MKTYSLILQLCLMLSLYSCQTQNKIHIAGLVIKKMQTADYYKKEFSTPSSSVDTKIWFRDSSIIQESYYIDYETVNDSTTIFTPRFNKFIFIDLKKKAVHEFRQYADTAIPYRSYPLDSISQPYYGESFWNFWTPRDNDDMGPFTPMADTVVDEIRYQFVRSGTRKMKGDTTITNTKIYYFLCSRKGTMFNLNDGITKQFGCPNVRTDMAFIPVTGAKKPGWVSSRIDFVADTLTPQQHKVFDAWERYSDLHPLKK